MQYLTVLYNAVLILGSDELGPVNAEEMFYVIMMMVVSTLINLFILGDIISLVEGISSDSSLYAERLTEVNKVMKNYKFDDDL